MGTGPCYNGCGAVLYRDAKDLRWIDRLTVFLCGSLSVWTRSSDCRFPDMWRCAWGGFRPVESESEVKK